MLKLYSLERRRERYVIIYVFKIICEYVPNFDDAGYSIKTYQNCRRGLLCHVPKINTSAMGRHKSLKDESLAVMGPKLFNVIPTDLRDVNLSLDSFKYKLDKFLSKINDKPSIPNYHQPARSNSIITQLAELRRNGIYI